MTETTDLLNGGEVLESLGQAWTLAHVGPGIRSKFSAWLKARARQGLREEREAGSLDADGYREESDALKARFDAGAYNWGSPLSPQGMGSAVAATLGETEGKIRLVQLLLERDHGQVTGAKIMEILAGAPEAAAACVQACLSPAPNGQAQAAQPGRTTVTVMTGKAAA